MKAVKRPKCREIREKNVFHSIWKDFFPFSPPVLTISFKESANLSLFKYRKRKQQKANHCESKSQPSTENFFWLSGWTTTTMYPNGWRRKVEFFLCAPWLVVMKRHMKWLSLFVLQQIPISFIQIISFLLSGGRQRARTNKIHDCKGFLIGWNSLRNLIVSWYVSSHSNTRVSQSFMSF